MGWISFGKADIGQELADLKAGQLDLKAGQRRTEALIMALASIEQSVLDELGTQLGAVADAVQAIIDDPSNDLGPADLTAVTDAVSRLQSLVAAPETPVEPAPVEPTPDEPTPA